MAKYLSEPERQMFLDMVFTVQQTLKERSDGDVYQKYVDTLQPTKIKFEAPSGKIVTMKEWDDFGEVMQKTGLVGVEGKERKLAQKWIKEADKRGWLLEMPKDRSFFSFGTR
ncbi:hypothetical protein EG329_014100 [Mollisiaceae sp. DMI_Dod_QoI]|nr:hypothetical protein EG329_014100 [Helotiales sp. DMI_Dod_QoI]